MLIFVLFASLAGRNVVPVNVGHEQRLQLTWRSQQHMCREAGCDVDPVYQLLEEQMARFSVDVSSPVVVGRNAHITRACTGTMAGLKEPQEYPPTVGGRRPRCVES
jgi:hypothetical protein